MRCLELLLPSGYRPKIKLNAEASAVGEKMKLGFDDMRILWDYLVSFLLKLVKVKFQ